MTVDKSPEQIAEELSNTSVVGYSYELKKKLEVSLKRARRIRFWARSIAITSLPGMSTFAGTIVHSEWGLLWAVIATLWTFAAGLSIYVLGVTAGWFDRHVFYQQIDLEFVEKRIRDS